MLGDKTGKRFFITGGSGFVGWNLCRFLKSRHEVFATYHGHAIQVDGCRFSKLDLTNRAMVLETVATIQPSIIIHTAAISSPDLCEKDKLFAWEVNVTGTQSILDAASQCNSRVVYISTDQVFDGEQGNYSETAAPRPINHYGVTKFEGEKRCRQSFADTVIVRITLQYGWGNGMSTSFTDWLLSSLKVGKQVSLFTDQYRSLTYVMDTIRGIELAALNAPAKEMYHLAGPDRINRYEFGLMLASIFNFPENLIKKSCIQDTAAYAPRPKDVSLDGNKFFKQFGFQPRGVREGLAALAQDITDLCDSYPQ